MTKAEIRKARKAARRAGEPLRGELELARDRDRGPQQWTESRRGYQARERWARRYDRLNGAPDGPEDR